MPAKKKQQMPAEFIDPYIDTSHNVLRNLVGATSYDELANAEGECVSARTAQLLSGEIPKLTGSLDDFKFLHHAIFRDIFDWAGQTRTVEIKKSAEDSEYFLPSSRIEQGFQWSQEQLKNDLFLQILDKKEFVRRLAFHYDNYNYIHPFREGNGRTQRLFWTILSHRAGYDLNWLKVSGKENDYASKIATETKDLSGLVKMFEKICIPCSPKDEFFAETFQANHLK